MIGLHLVYKIDSVNDANGRLKEIPKERRMKRYHLTMLAEGISAILSDIDSDGHLKTSIVEKISISNNVVIVKTENSEYYLKPVIEGVNYAK